MNKTKIFLASGLLLFAFSFCKKKEIKGPQGDPGTNGTGGNSSIQSSAIFSVDSTAWKLSSDSKFWEVTLAQPLITSAVIDKGAVKVYYQISGYWWELPYAIADYVTQFSFKENILHLSVIDVEGGLPPKPVTANYRVVTFTEAP